MPVQVTTCHHYLEFTIIQIRQRAKEIAREHAGEGDVSGSQEENFDDNDEEDDVDFNDVEALDDAVFLTTMAARDKRTIQGCVRFVCFPLQDNYYIVFSFSPTHQATLKMRQMTPKAVNQRLEFIAAS